MISRVAVLPTPPLLVPRLAGGGDPGADALRAAVLAVAAQLGTGPWTVVGTGGPGPHPPVGTFAGYGVDERVSLSGTPGDTADPDPSWPLSLLTACWLRERVGAESAVPHLVAPDADPEDCRALGRALAADPDAPEALLVLGDGSHRHGDRAVGRPDERAPGFDEAVAAALAAASGTALMRVDAELAADLGAEGRAPWQVLAGAVEGRRWQAAHAELSIPFGVAYHLALWEPV